MAAVAPTALATTAAAASTNTVLATNTAAATSTERQSAPAKTATTTVDGVALTIGSRDLPAAGFVASNPGDVYQSASATDLAPFTNFAVTAVPFGHVMPGAPNLGGASAAAAPAWQQALATAQGGGPARPGPAGTLFGHKAVSTLTTPMIALTRTARSAVDRYTWVVAAGGRLWVVRAEQDHRIGRPGFGADLTIASASLAAATTIASGASSTPKPAGPKPVTAASVPGLGSTPSWWSGDCDVNNAPGESRQNSWNGLESCGNYSGGSSHGTEREVTFPGGGPAVSEFQCVELPTRYAYLAWGVPVQSVGHGYNFANAYNGRTDQSTGKPLVMYDNTSGTAHLPKVGDVVSSGNISSTNGDGHVAVVTAVDSSVYSSSHTGTIHLMDENWNPGGSNTISVSGGTVKPLPGMVGVTWLHDTADDAPPPVPQVTVTLPAGQPYSGTVTFVAHTDIGVDQLYFHVSQNGSERAVLVPGKPGTNDHYFSLDTKTLQNGSAQIWAAAVTPAGVTGTSARSTIQIANAVPPPPPSGPPAPVVSVPGGPVSGTVTLSATDSDPTVQSVQFFAGGTAIGSPVGAPFQLSWDTTATGQYGTVTITATATSPGGTSPVSGGADVYVNRLAQARPAAVTDGNGTLHVYTIAAPNGELEETLVAPDGGTTHSCVTCNVGTPMSQGAPAAVIDSGGTIHIYTIAKPNGELEETLLAPDGGTAWSCLTCNGGAEFATGAPSAVIDGGGTIHIYTLAAGSGEVDETLSAPDGGLAWSCLSCNGGAEPGYGAPAAVIDGSGTIHVFTLAIAGFFDSGEIDETMIPASGALSWVCLSCSNGGAEPAYGAPAAVVDKSGTIRVYTLAIAGFFNPGEIDETRITSGGAVENTCLSCSNGGAEPAAGAPSAIVDAAGAVHVYTYAIAGFFNAGELDETTIPASGATVNTCVTCNGGAPDGAGTPGAALDGSGGIHVFSVGTPGGDLDETWWPAGGSGWQWSDRTSGAPNTPPVGV